MKIQVRCNTTEHLTSHARPTSPKHHLETCPRFASVPRTSHRQRQLRIFGSGRDADGCHLRAYNSKQISALVAAAAGRVETGADLQSPSFAPLQQTLEVSDSVAVALLRVLDRSGTTPDRLANSLAESAMQYHAVLDSLAEMNVYDPIASQPVMRAQAAMTAGRFSDAETELRQVEDHELAASGRSSGASAVVDEHWLVAAQVRTLLGRIALMKLEYSEAAEDFLLARQRLSVTPSDQPSVTEPPAITAPELADASEPLQNQGGVIDMPRPIDGHEAPEARPPVVAPPSVAHDEATLAIDRSTLTLLQPTVMKPAQPDRLKPVAAPITGATAKPPRLKPAHPAQVRSVKATRRKETVLLMAPPPSEPPRRSQMVWVPAPEGRG